MARRSYADRTHSNSPAAKILAEAFCRKVEYVETKHGDRIRQWRKDELQTFKDDDIARALRRRRALEMPELLEEIPPSAVKMAVTKGWLIQHGDLYLVTDRAAEKFALPAKTADGLKIRFAKAA